MQKIMDYQPRLQGKSKKPKNFIKNNFWSLSNYALEANTFNSNNTAFKSIRMFQIFLQQNCCLISTIEKFTCKKAKKLTSDGRTQALNVSSSFSSLFGCCFIWKNQALLLYSNKKCLFLQNYIGNYRCVSRKSLALVETHYMMCKLAFILYHSFSIKKPLGFLHFIANRLFQS